MTSSATTPFYIARHGDAVLPGIDPRRPLSVEGLAQVHWVAREAAKRLVQVSTVYHSGILRAEQTAEIFAQHLAPAEGVHQISGLLPDDDPLFGKAELEAATAPIMLVGHLPYMERLADLLAGGGSRSPVSDFPTATLVCFSRTLSGWDLQWQLRPKLS